MKRPKIVTIGVYGFDEAGFFEALRSAEVDVSATFALGATAAAVVTVFIPVIRFLLSLGSYALGH